MAIHALAGALLGNWIVNPLFAFILGIASHFLIDMIPHKDMPDYRKGNDVKHFSYNKTKVSWPQLNIVVINIIVSVAAIIYILTRPEHSASYFLAILGAILPDIPEDFPYIKYKYKKSKLFRKVHNFHHDIQQYKISCAFGLFIQYIFGIILLFFCIRYL